MGNSVYLFALDLRGVLCLPIDKLADEDGDTPEGLDPYTAGLPMPPGDLLSKVDATAVKGWDAVLLWYML